VTGRSLLRRMAPGVAAGFAGTAVMTATAAAYSHLRGPAQPDHQGIAPVIDFDTSDHVIIAAGTILRVTPRSPAARKALFHLVHWGYGSLVGVGRQLLHRTPAPTLFFFLGCQTMACALFPLVGDTPPPWRWTREQLTVSLAQHAIYALTVSAALKALGHRGQTSAVSTRLPTA
jgi:hypothetical protein